jgi:hypothetical protein
MVFKAKIRKSEEETEERIESTAIRVQHEN